MSEYHPLYKTGNPRSDLFQTPFITAPNTEGFQSDINVDWPTSYTYEYEERLHRRRKLFLVVATCFILAGLGFAALYFITGG